MLDRRGLEPQDSCDMTKADSQRDIENVLSSIRRLVSQDVRGDVSGPNSARDPGLLVLTPAHLVNETEQPSAAVDITPAASDTRPSKIAPPQDWEPDFDDSAVDHWPQDGAGLEASFQVGDELSRLEDTIARLEAEVTQSEADFESETGDRFSPDGVSPLAELPEEFDPSSLSASVAEAASDREAAPEDELIDPDLLRADWEQTARPDPDWPGLDAVEAAPSEPRRLHLSDAEEWHQAPPKRPSSYERTREEIALEVSFPEADNFTVVDFEARQDAALDFALPIDEDALQALVRDLIRQELQGELGARITRNLRKLVRREVQRALLSRDLE